MTEKVEYQGRLVTTQELADIVGLSQTTVWRRLKRGLSVEEAIRPPAERYKNCGRAAQIRAQSMLGYPRGRLPYYWELER